MADIGQEEGLRIKFGADGLKLKGDESRSSSSASSPESNKELYSGSSTPAIPIASVLRRASSSASANSASGSNPTARERKKLRFTPLTDDNNAGPSKPTNDVFYPGPAGWDAYKSDPGTPNFSETADQIRRTLSLASLDQLLADSSSREKFIAGVSRAGRDLVWRDKDDPRLFPRSFERALLLALKRGLRSFLLSFSVRAGVNVLLMLFRTFRKKGFRIALLRHAIFGAEPFRFGAMIGSFTLLYTLTIHLLRLTPPIAYIRRRIRYGLKTPPFGPPIRDGSEGERRWQAAVAGAVGSLGLLWETVGRRRGVAQQMFVRGLQGAYNHYTPHFGIHIPHGDILVFGACCGQIMFAWLMSPETMPRDYTDWITRASRVPPFAVLGNRSAVRTRTVSPSLIEEAINNKYTSAANRTVLGDYLDMLKQDFKPPSAVPCELVHPWCTSCYDANWRRFFDVFRFMLPVYSALHLIPTLVLRRQHVQRDPLRMLAKVTWGITRSCSFLGVFVVIFHGLMCIRYQIIQKGLGTRWLRALLKRKQTFWLFGFSTCLSLFVEEKKRRAELAMYVLPRALESAWSTARRRAWVPIVPFGETILGASAMAMVMDSYKHNPEALSGVVRKLLYQLVGPV